MKKHLLITTIVLVFSFSAMSQWTSDVLNNTTLCNNSGTKFSTVVTPGLNGQVYIVWLEANPTLTVKMQLVNADGTLCWAPQGLTISTSLQNENPVPLNITSDENGNAYIVWYDSESGINKLSASKISPSGNFLWGTEGVYIYQTGSHYIANTSICLSNAGNLMIGSEMVSLAGDEKNYILLHKLDYNGINSWETFLMIDDTLFNCCKPKLVPSGYDGCIVSFTKFDGVLVNGTVKLWVQKFGEYGNTMFGNGVEIFNQGNMTPWDGYDVISGGNDDMLIAWNNYAYDSPRPESYLQHISSDGVLSWSHAVILTSDPIVYSESPMIAGKNQNDETIVFFKNTSVENGIPMISEVYAQKISASGDRLWTDLGKKIISNLDTITTFLMDDAFISNNLSFLVYDRTEIGDLQMMWNKIFAVGIDNNADPLWQDTSITLSLSNTTKSYIGCTSFANNQSVVGWVETDTTGNAKIKGQNFRLDGSIRVEEQVQQSSDVILLPNPVKDVLTFISKSSLSSVSVFDLAGKLLLTIRSESINKINLSHLNPGVYFVKYMTISGEYGSKKIIKN